MSASITVSILVPVFNERYLVEASLKGLEALRRSPRVRWAQIIVVDDGSTDGSREILQRLARKSPRQGRLRWLFLEHPANRGKGAAFRTALERAQGDVCVIHDADLEYDAEDIPELLVPFINGSADAVYGSRFLPRRWRRVGHWRHEQINRVLTRIANVVTNYGLTDSATCYKAVRTDLLRSIPLQENDFAFEPELTVKLAKRGARLFEVPISYAGRSAQEGKKIGLMDGWHALRCYLKYWADDTLFKGGSLESNWFARVARAARHQAWTAERLRPWIGQRVLELGARTGHLSHRLLPRDLYVAADHEAYYLDSLRRLAQNKPYFKVAEADPAGRLPAGRFDTVMALNVLQFQDDPGAVVKNLAARLQPGGRLLVLAPAHPWLYGAQDRALGQRQRFKKAELAELARAAGLSLECLEAFNRSGSLPWLVHSRLLRRRHAGLMQVLISDALTPLFRRLDSWLPLPATAWLMVASKPTRGN